MAKQTEKCTVCRGSGKTWDNDMRQVTCWNCAGQGVVHK